MMVEKYLRNLSELVLKKMEEGNYTIGRFADECGISQRELSRIKNGEAKSININTLSKICEHSGISYIDVFDLKEDLDDYETRKCIEKLEVFHGKSKFRLTEEKHR